MIFRFPILRIEYEKTKATKMSIDVNIINRKMKKIQEQEQRIKLQKTVLLKKKKAAKDYTLQKMGEIFFDNFRVSKGLDTISSKASLLTSIKSSKLSDKEKKKLSDLIENGILNFERAGTGAEKASKINENNISDLLR